MKETLRIFFPCITSHLPITPSKGYECQASCSSLPLLFTLVSVQEWFQVYHLNGPVTFNFNSTTTPDCRISYYSQLVSFQPFELICKSACLTLPLLQLQDQSSPPATIFFKRNSLNILLLWLPPGHSHPLSPTITTHF